MAASRNERGPQGPSDPRADLEARLAADAQAFGGPAPDLAGALQLGPRVRYPRRRGVLARAVVCGALATILLQGAQERAGLQRAGRYLPVATHPVDTPEAPARAAREVAAMVTGSGARLEQELEALAQDAEGLLEALGRGVAPLASVVADPE